jgi:hypothetical protein
MKATAFLPADPQRAHVIWSELWKNVKALTLAGHKLQVTVEPERRNADQNAMLHALLSEIADRIEWAGKKRDTETWKRLMTAAWLRARGESIEVLPAIDGHGIDVVFRRTSSLTKSECAELIDFVTAWAVQNGVEFSDTEGATA